MSLFTETDYSSNDGMMTDIWGPCLWHTLHAISFNYPTHPTREHRVHYARFMLSLRHVLPCGHCRTNYKANMMAVGASLGDIKRGLRRDGLATHPVFQSRASFSRFMYELHEQVNAMLEKRSGLTYEAVRERYEAFRSRCLQPQSTTPEGGCVEPMYTGKKSRCILRIIPRTNTCRTFAVNQDCVLRRRAAGAKSPRLG